MQRGAWILLLWSLATTQVQAQSPLPLALDWHAPGECPQAEAVRAELARIARARPGHALAPLSARAEVIRRGGAYETLLHTEHAGKRGERPIAARDCISLMRTVTLVLALTFGTGIELTDDATRPSTRDQTQDATPSPSPPSQPSAQASSTQPSEGRAAQARSGTREKLPWAATLGLGARFGLLASAAASVSLGAELMLGSWSLAARAHGAFAPRTRVDAAIDARFFSVGGALSGCGALPLGPLSGSLCVGGQAAVVRGSASGSLGQAVHAPWYALAAGLALSWPRESVLRLRAEGWLHVSLNRPRFVIEGLGDVYRVSRLVPELALVLVFAP